MNDKLITVPTIADPTIEDVFEDFLNDQRKRLKPRTVSRYEEVIWLLSEYLNNYAYQSLSKAESVFFDKHYNTEEGEHKKFCQLFGPDKIIDELAGFFNYFLIRKVMAGIEVKRMTGTVVKKLSKWLAEKGYVSDELAMEGIQSGADASRNLPKAERASRILCETVRDFFFFGVNRIKKSDCLEFDHYCIERVEPGKLWFVVYDGRKNVMVGPVLVPSDATNLLQEGWTISCSLARIRGEWRIVEMANVYPL